MVKFDGSNLDLAQACFLMICGAILFFKMSLLFDFKIKPNFIGVYLFRVILVEKYKYEDMESLFIYDKVSYKEPTYNVFKVTNYQNRWFSPVIWLIMKDGKCGSKFIKMTVQNDVEFIKAILKAAPHLKCANYE